MKEIKVNVVVVCEVAPKAFLQRLSENELGTIQQAYWLADPINISSLSEEGALNLLLPPAAQFDINHDGITKSGLANSVKFPDSNTPSEVVTAWNEATDGMPIEERMIYEFEMVAPVMLANIVMRDDGSFSHQRMPGDPDFVNPKAAEDYSYVGVTKNWIEHLDYFKQQIEPDRYQKSMSFWKGFQESLIRNEAP